MAEMKNMLIEMEQLAQALTEKLAQEYQIQAETSVQEVLKTNVRKLGITVKVSDGDGPIIAPTVYPDSYPDLSFEETVDAMARAVNEGIKHRPELPVLTAEEARRHITLTVMNAEKNMERLEHTPHFKFADEELAAVPRWKIDESASFIVTDQLASHMGLTPDEVLQIGQQNIESQHFTTKSMQETLMEMMPPEMMEMMPPMDAGPEMLVVTSPDKIQGASALLDEKTMQAVHERLGGDFVVLPSSIHEVICLPITDDMSPQELRSMVQEVNATQVRPEERLSDQVFRCDGRKLTMVGESLTPEVEAPAMKQQSMKFAM